MPRSKYYRELGLSSDASEQEVRKKYRRLVMKYHPDKNQQVGAQEKFIAITEAYEILTRKKDYTSKQSYSQSQKTEEEAIEERLQKARKRYQENKYKEYIENERYFQFLTSGKKWRMIKATAVIGTFLSFLLMADYFLPRHYEEDNVTHYALNQAHSINAVRLSLINTENHGKFWVSNITHNLYGNTPKIYVESSWIFHNPVHIIANKKLENRYFDIYFNAYKTSWILIIAFLIPLFTLIYKRRSVYFTILYHISYFGITFLTAIILLTGDRWIHVLTLGFI